MNRKCYCDEIFITDYTGNWQNANTNISDENVIKTYEMCGSDDGKFDAQK